MLGIIGGTGLYKLEGLVEARHIDESTPLGKPSSPITVGRLGAVPVAFLARHGLHHEFLPSEINYRANLFALKAVGATDLLSVSAVGSLQREYPPGSLVLPNQFIDLTKGVRAPSFFGNGIAAHISTGQPTCGRLESRVLAAAGNERIFTKKTYACVEGPRLGTAAETRMLTTLGGNIVGMTNLPEAFLAREAQLCYASLCIVTDYDSGAAEDGAATEVDAILAEYARSINQVQTILRALTAAEAVPATCACRTSLRAAVLTPDERLTAEQRAMMKVLRA